MSVTYNATLKNTRMTDVVTAIGATGFLNIYSAAPVLLASISLDNPAGTVTGGVLTFTSTPRTDSTADGTGTASGETITTARVGGGTLLVSGRTVGPTATDIVLPSRNIIADQPVAITAMSITHG